MPPANSPILTELILPGEPERWAAIGFTIVDRCFALEQVICRVGAPAPGWSFVGSDSSRRELCGIETGQRPRSPAASKAAPHVNTATKIDHVVVTSQAPSATKRALEGFGLVARGERVVEGHGARRTQAFFWSGGLLIELVGPADHRPDATALAAIWGVTFVVSDLSALQAAAGALLQPARPAVQAGRQIATVAGAAQLGIELAFMTPHASAKRA